ncbi:MAG TPA: indole-3-glycerol phosphate synthase TrpC [Bacteroidales bacterium]|nr:indole-3-glycerol phosphate synthase TrpC [Bacteroidales bacterium]
MTILDQIIYRKRLEVEKCKSLRPVSILNKSEFLSSKPKSLKDALMKRCSSGIIAEFKRRSPSKGIINNGVEPGNVCKRYASAGASAVSVLTNQEFFGGSVYDMNEVSHSVNCPVLCKDFVIDEYQIIEARSAGADAVLLISDILSARKMNELYRFVLSLGMDALIEIHDKKYLNAIPQDAAIIGINSRNLASLNVTIDHSLELASLIPDCYIKVAESGIRSVGDYFTLKNAGFHGFLIGEYFMNSADPGQTCCEFIEAVRKDYPANPTNIVRRDE